MPKEDVGDSLDIVTHLAHSVQSIPPIRSVSKAHKIVTRLDQALQGILCQHQAELADS